MTLDKNRLKIFVSWFLKKHGEKKTLEFLEQLKVLGFGYATQAGISLGIEDLKIPPSKTRLLAHAEKNVADSIRLYRKGEMTGIEKMQRFIETWHETSELLKDEVVSYFEKTDVLNPVYMMAFSGARGNLSQVRQLVGMRGLMADPQGKIIDFPILSNFREGLTLTEYLISTYGARKGIVDTALRTATAGYLTRRLVDVAQHVLISKFDCGTRRGIFLFDMKEGNKTIYSFEQRLIGRVLNQDFEHSDPDFSPQTSKVAKRNQEITPELANLISKFTKKALVRSPLTCQTRKLVCQLCYGWSLATSKLVSIGEAVGVIAGQSIGEPGTQLTMRTFHTGGVFSAGISQQIKAPCSGIVEYATPISGTCVRTPHGNLAFLTKTSGVLFLKATENSNASKLVSTRANDSVQNLETIQTYKLPPFTVLFARHGEFVTKETLIAQISALPVGQKQTQIIEQTIYSSFEGEVYYNNIDLLEDLDDKYGERISKSEDWARVWVLSAKLYHTPFPSTFFPVLGDFVSKESVLNQIQWVQKNSSTVFFDGKSRPAKGFNQTQYSKNIKCFLNSKLETYSKSTQLSRNFKKRTQSTKPAIQFDFEKRPDKTLDRKQFLISSNFQFEKNAFPKIQKLLSFLESSNRQVFKTNNRNRKRLNSSFSNSMIYYPFQSPLRVRFSKFLTQNPLCLPLLRPGFLNSWLKTQVFVTRPVQDVFQNSSRAFQIETLLKTKFQTQQKFKHPKLSSAEPVHPLVLTNFVPFFLKTTQFTRYLKRKKAFRSFESTVKKTQKTNVFRPNAGLFKNKSFRIDEPQKNREYLKLFFKKSYENRAELFKKETKNEKLSIKKSVLIFPIQNLTYSKLGYFASRFVKTKETDAFFSVLSLQNARFETASENPTLFTMQDKITKNSTSFVSAKGKSSFGLNNVDGWNPPTKPGFYWFPKASEFIIDGLACFQSPSFFQKQFQSKYFSNKQKSSKNVKRQTKAFMQSFNLAHSYRLKNIQSGTFDFNPTNSKKISRFLNAEDHQTIPVSFAVSFKSEISKTTNVSFRIEKRNVCLDLFRSNKIKQSRPFFDPLKTFPIENPFEIRWKKRKTTVDPNLQAVSTSTQKQSFATTDMNSKLFSRKNRSKENALKNSRVLFNEFQKNSVSFTEVYALSQKNYHLKSYSFRDSGSENLKQPNVLFVNSKKTNVYLTNNQGFKKPLCFEQEGVLTVQPTNRFSFLDLKNVSKTNQVFLRFDSVGSSSNRPSTFSLKTKTSVPGDRFALKNTRTFLVKRHFLKHLNTARLEKNAVFLKSQTEKPLVRDMGSFTLAHKQKLNSEIFTFLPFSVPTKTNVKKKRVSNSITSNSRPKSPTTGSTLLLNYKPGWIYITNDSSLGLTTQPITCEPGKNIIEDIYFDQNKVFFERFQTSSLDSKSSKINEGSSMFYSLKTIQNPKTRFFKKNEMSPFLKACGVVSPRQKSSFVLFRPFQYRILENPNALKQKLYTKLKRKNRFSMHSSDSGFHGLKSFEIYKDFFSTKLNTQTRNTSSFANCACPDFTLKGFEMDSFRSIFAKFSKTLNEQYDFQKTCMTFSKRRLKQLPKTFFDSPKTLKSLLRIPQNATFYTIHSVNFGQVQISLEVSDFLRTDTSFGQIEFHSTNQSVYQATQNSEGLPSRLHKHYLNFLAFRKSNAGVFQNPVGVSNQRHAFEKKSFDPIDLSTVTFPFCGFDSLPVFDYSVNEQYGFFVNQRLFASAFYKETLKQFLKFDSLNLKGFSHENSNEQRFIKTKTSANRFADAMFFNPRSKNQIRLSPTQLNVQNLFGFTNFYSPFEGEILKDYDDENVLKNSEKSLNLYFETGIQQSRKTHKLILTKSDVFGLNFDDPTFQEKQNAIVRNTTLQLFKNSKTGFFEALETKQNFNRLLERYGQFQKRETDAMREANKDIYRISDFTTFYQNKLYRLKNLRFGLVKPFQKYRLGTFFTTGDALDSNRTSLRSGQIIHFNFKKLTLRKAEIFSISPKAILHTYNGHYITKDSPVMTLPFETLKTGDIVQGIPKVEQYLEARTTIQGRLFLNSLPFLLYAIFQRYLKRLNMEKAVRQSFLKIQQILVDGVQRVYRSQGVSIADKHLEIIVRQMTSKVKITYGGQTGFFSGELVELEFVERMNRFLKIKVRYEPVVLGITRASLEVDSFLSAASFQQTTKVLTRAALENKKDFLKGLKENLLVGNLLPAGTGYLIPSLSLNK